MKWTSAAAIFFVIFIACLIVAYASDSSLQLCDDDTALTDDSCVGDTTLFSLDINTFKVFGVFIFAYSCQMNIFPVVNELRNPTIKRYNTVIYMSIATALVLYCVVAGAGYSTYGDNVESNILVSYPSKDIGWWLVLYSICAVSNSLY